VSFSIGISATVTVELNATDGNGEDTKMRRSEAAVRVRRHALRLCAGRRPAAADAAARVRLARWRQPDSFDLSSSNLRFFDSST
jgi:hypothetical protein